MREAAAGEAQSAEPQCSEVLGARGSKRGNPRRGRAEWCNPESAKRHPGRGAVCMNQEELYRIQKKASIWQKICRVEKRVRQREAAAGSDMQQCSENPGEWR